MQNQENVLHNPVFCLNRLTSNILGKIYSSIFVLVR
ncbi:hypothetical protein HMPREF1536_04805 [Parabacteroides gordonii MS-1 = DSM 23371]|mgnify:FL=1|jgi:hypothetical protein|uniref:Uncharacterized protein n=1 Tax=Parabacteroides gordonii MS-1 = DSM 23371 TaxID=1203610 RepID=A0A0F5IS07_9BACT|nr:hypothetical protein HMPREF1536_04805 [Parabacteroides gordonii MS-1 = DSM 23371]